MILSTVGGLLVRDRPDGWRAGLYAETVGGPGGRAELDADEVETLADALDEWLRRVGRRVDDRDRGHPPAP